ncbi:pyridoxal phosphate-dependent aminotransferase family protein [Sulfurihydrogenibium sp.]|uniref:aminotransferase class I/II-fold pyridoxal phosphate-dependent enzyme n=1 Tax=Sulfurihydrogenibium sp. TaxID=2053621 RepID=UPI002623FA06|nr:pyridoxal phosphate-dependent aminotransferase family protein [Sulfurihydrogenibium sp.]
METLRNFIKFLEESLEEVKSKNLYRERLVIPDDFINFSSNDYLGLKDNQKTKEKLKENLEKLSLGSGASVLVSGYTQIQKDLEEFIANFKQTQSCIVVGSGYMANVGLIQAIVKEEDVIFSDELNHASIIDGIRLSKAKKVIYKHLDLNDLEEKIKKTSTRGIKYIITDGVFSMEGDIAPLDKLVEIVDKYDAVLIVDDAHGTGITGEGRGTLFHFSIKPKENIIQMGTLSKAVGSYGAFICGCNTLIDYLVNKMRSVIFTTGLSPIQNFISLENFKLLAEEDFRRFDVLKKAQYLYEKLNENGIDINFHNTPILSYVVKSEEKAIKIRNYLMENKIFVQAIRPPTVPQGTSRLRITLTYNNKYEDIDKLLSLIKNL